MKKELSEVQQQIKKYMKFFKSLRRGDIFVMQEEGLGRNMYVWMEYERAIEYGTGLNNILVKTQVRCKVRGIGITHKMIKEDGSFFFTFSHDDVVGKI